MVFLTLLPAVLLLIYVFKKDRREKEPFGILFGCFCFGVLSTIPSIVAELIGEEIVSCFFDEGSAGFTICTTFFVVGLAEEGFKYLGLKLKTWKSPHFDCSFDGIVYAVFVSVGFAALENITYVYGGGLSVAILRMFTAVPAHACDAVFMGYFYSKARQARLLGNKAEEKKNKKKALFIPVLLHGLYDCLISFDSTIVGLDIVFKSVLLWLAFVIAYFIVAFITVKRASDEDTYFEVNPALKEADRIVAFKSGNWLCDCGRICTGNFCSNCGSKKPE